MITPRNTYILIEPLEDEKVLSSGIIIPDTSKERPTKGRVVSTPSDSDFEVGTTVLYKKWGGTEVKVEGKDMLLVDEEDILAVLEADE